MLDKEAWLDAMPKKDNPAKLQSLMTTDHWRKMEAHNSDQGEGRALTLGSTERLGTLRPANLRTLNSSLRAEIESTPHTEGGVCAFMGGGRTGENDYYILEDDDKYNEDILTPGHLQDRLLTLQARALDAIKALPAHCREDQGYGLVETRVWGLEALKHILRMRLALQGSIQLTRPVPKVARMPPNNELLAANLTLVIRNRGNRCFANSVLRLWCWMGAHHENPGEFWGASTNLCLQLLQQDDIADIFWASEIQPVLEKLENPQAQHDASEFLVHCWEFWKQTGLQGGWHSYFGGRWHGFETLPLFVRMPQDAGEDVTLEQLLDDWANEANGQCLGAEVEHIVFHIGRYFHCSKARAWVKHHHKLQIPSTFQCAQRSSTGHGGKGTFVLRGVIAHQGESLSSGHYVSMLVEGEALWTVDDGECPQAQQHIPEIFKTGAVMIWASRAEHSSFWTRTIGCFEPPTKRPRLTGDGVEIFYSNITQWNNAAKEWVLQQAHPVIMLVETHLQGPKLELAEAALCRSRWQPASLPAWETGRGGNSGGQIFCCKEGHSSYRLHHYDHEGNGFLANVLQRQQWELVLVSLYLKCGEDLNSHANAQVLGQLAAFLTELGVP